jgi:hypothetical protein
MLIWSGIMRQNSGCFRAREGLGDRGGAKPTLCPLR